MARCNGLRAALDRESGQAISEAFVGLLGAQRVTGDPAAVSLPLHWYRSAFGLHRLALSSGEGLSTEVNSAPRSASRRNSMGDPLPFPTPRRAGLTRLVDWQETFDVRRREQPWSPNG